MPDLRRVLSGYDSGQLRLMAELWGLELRAASQREAVEELAPLMLSAERVSRVAAGLPPEARAAFERLARDGREPLAPFTRRHGELRAMGPARRDRERPWENGASTTEVLWYRGLIAVAFFDDGRGLEEFAFIPDDLRTLVYVAEAREAAQPAGDPPGAPAQASAGVQPLALAGAAAGDVVTLLAYLQVEAVRPEGASLPARHLEALSRCLRQPTAIDLYLHLAQALGLAAGAPLKLDSERVRPFLEASGHERARRLAQAWRESADWNDLLHVPGLVFEVTAWRNDPLAAREAILALLAQVPPGAWWSLPSFVAAVKDRHPDFQRPAGDYDSWYIRDAASQSYLRGFENWERVDGSLVRWLLTRPLAWLGIVEVAAGEAAEAFRLTAFGAAWLGLPGGEAPEPQAAPMEVADDGTVRVPPGASAYERFQLARISDWLPLDGPGYAYRLTPAALTRAAKKGIGVARIVAFLEQAAAGRPALPALVAALRRWERQGSEARVHDGAVLKLSSAELLDTLRRTPGVRELLGEALAPNVVLVPRDQLPALRAALARLGILADG